MEHSTPRNGASVAVIIPVLHEQKRINTLVSNVRKLAGPRHVEIIVVDGAASADTLKALRHKALKALTAPAGRASQMNAGAEVSTTDIILFLHADTTLPPQAFDNLLRAVEDGAEAGAFSLGFDAQSLGLRIIAATANLRSRLTRAPYGDQAQFFTRTAFERLGGYAPLPLMEDLDIMTRARKLGLRVTILPDRVTTSSRRWRKEGLVRCTLRNWCIRLLYHCGVPAARLAGWYRPNASKDTHNA
ncbi:TIGR04283 family arsenosugar biosynthesis glycosyltransferase [Desulfobaculum sp. SPO524]|uniref:TIGR04283 family arsenosugar biosynthesis glycosyltransferase n=1 Tax=Desulfobaculum sp. SPO524 TaxID=3378071 RepID=UPI0038543FB9